MDKKKTLTIALGVIAVAGAYFAFKAITKPKTVSATGRVGLQKCRTTADCPQGKTCVGENPRVCVGSSIQTIPL
jgi:hypothetical protein